MSEFTHMEQMLIQDAERRVHEAMRLAHEWDFTGATAQIRHAEGMYQAASYLDSDVAPYIRQAMDLYAEYLGCVVSVSPAQFLEQKQDVVGEVA